MAGIAHLEVVVARGVQRLRGSTEGTAAPACHAAAPMTAAGVGQGQGGKGGKGGKGGVMEGGQGEGGGGGGSKGKKGKRTQEEREEKEAEREESEAAQELGREAQVLVQQILVKQVGPVKQVT
jgi:hypothetical protein